MNREEPSTRTVSAAPKAAAIAGIVFSVLLIISLVLFLVSVPNNLRDGGTWLSTRGNTVLLALNLLPFSGIAFLWFMGVVRDRIGKEEDRFFVTVFLGSGLLFLALFFASASMTGGIILLYLTQSDRLLSSSFYDFGSTVVHEMMNNYAIKMAGVFMISTSTLFIRTRVIPRWMALLGYALAVLMLLRMSHLDRLSWVILFFPLWVLLISIYILIDNYRKKTGPMPT
jgi:hypothetical protein